MASVYKHVLTCSSSVRRSLEYTVRRSYYVRPKKKETKGSWQAWAMMGAVTATVSGLAVYQLGKPEEEIVGLESEPDVYAGRNFIVAYLSRAWDKVVSFRKSFTEPSRDYLLPDPLPYPYRKPYTLVIELNDILLHSEYDRKMGWKYQKRPKIEYFLNSLVDYYEIVIFTTENAWTAHPLIEKMDPEHFIIYRLYRDSTKYEKGQHIKDLANLNRSLNRVIVVDTNPTAVKKQSENSLILDKWTGETSDNTLVTLSSFLLNIATNNVGDVREVLDYYKSFEGKNVLEVFKDKQDKLRAELEAMEASKKQSTASKTPGSISVFSLGSASRQYSSQMDKEQPSPAATTTMTDNVSGHSTAQEDNPSLIGWIGSWVGWK